MARRKNKHIRTRSIQSSRITVANCSVWSLAQAPTLVWATHITSRTAPKQLEFCTTQYLHWHQGTHHHTQFSHTTPATSRTSNNHHLKMTVKLVVCTAKLPSFLKQSITPWWYQILVAVQWVHRIKKSSTFTNHLVTASKKFHFHGQLRTRWTMD